MTAPASKTSPVVLVFLILLIGLCLLPNVIFFILWIRKKVKEAKAKKAADAAKTEG